MYRAICIALALAAGAAAAQEARRPDPADSKAKAPPTEYRSAFTDYKPFAEQEPSGWREANEEVGAAGGHAGHRPGQGPAAQRSKPQPETPATSGGAAPNDGGQGGHHQ